MNLGQLGVGVAVLVIVVSALLAGGVNTPETSAPTGDTDRSIGADMTEPSADDTPPEDSSPGTEQEPVVADDDGIDDSDDDGTANKSGSKNGTFETVETGDDDAGSPTRMTGPRDNPVGVPDYNDGDGDDGLSDDSSSDDSADDSSADNSTDDAFSGDSADDVGNDTGDDPGGGLSGGGSGDDIGVCTV